MYLVSLVGYMFRVICELSSGLDINTGNRKIIITATYIEEFFFTPILTSEQQL